MFKNASNNMQARDRSSALNAPTATRGDDFMKQLNDLENERAGLVNEKKEHEIFLQRVKYDKVKHLAGMGMARSPLNQNVRLKWEYERKERLKRVSAIDKRLLDIRIERGRLTEKKRILSYTDAFYRCAKDILPSDVMDRIHSASIAVLAHVNDR